MQSTMFTPDNNRLFGETVYEILELKGIPKKNFKIETHLNNSRIKNGSSSFTNKTKQKTAKALGVPLWLIELKVSLLWMVENGNESKSAQEINKAINSMIKNNSNISDTQMFQQISPLVYKTVAKLASILGLNYSALSILNEMTSDKEQTQKNIDTLIEINNKVEERVTELLDTIRKEL